MADSKDKKDKKPPTKGQVRYSIGQPMKTRKVRSS